MINWKNKIIDYLAVRQKWLEGISIFLLCLAVGFKYEKGETTWIWSDYPVISILIVLCILFIAIIWIRIERIKIDRRIKELYSKHKTNNSAVDLTKLSNRQQEVLDLIKQGKSNKEIISELFIEHSTLKTHINQIYKTLKVKNRKEAKSLAEASEK